MARKRFNKGFGKSPSKIYKSNNLYAGNISMAQAFEIFEPAQKEDAQRILEYMIITSLAVFILVQLSISSRPESSDWIDQLPSVRDVKQKFINGNIGLTTAACFGLALAFPYALESFNEDENIHDSLINLANELVNSFTTNVKRIKPSKQNFLLYARGEMGAVKGQFLSCPSTNIAILNIDGSEVLSFGIESAISKIGFEKDTLEKHGINVELIIKKMKALFLSDAGGLPIDKITYDEPNFVNSKIQNEILSENISRTGELKSKLLKGVEPSSSISKSILNKYLNKNEMFAYNIAIRTGDVQMSKKLTDIAIQRSKENL